MKKILILVGALTVLGFVPAYAETNSAGALQKTVAAAPASAVLPAPWRAPKPKEMSCVVVYPVAGDDYVTTAKNTSATFSPLYNDTDTPDQDFLGFDQPAHGTVVQIGLDGLRYTPNANYVGSDTFTYTLGGCTQCFGSGSGAWCAEPASTTGYVYITVTN
ncbi:MAG TPA: Ig-like domain-containing protein [Thermoanaerobaculia bacterium]|jgi:hypothetical protein|nr:Ig-like domain-containing protein [Thermoanaerobaculia bacterium]